MIALENLPFVDLGNPKITEAQEPPTDAIVVQLTDGRAVWLARDNHGALMLMGTGMIDPIVRDVIQEQYRNQSVTQILSVVQPATLARSGSVSIVGNAMYKGGNNGAFEEVERRKADAAMDRADYHTGRDRDD